VWIGFSPLNRKKFILALQSPLYLVTTEVVRKVSPSSTPVNTFEKRVGDGSRRERGALFVFDHKVSL
jgi:hypothetical protein